MKVSATRIYGLGDFQLNRAQLKSLGARLVSVSIQQRGPVLSRLSRFRPRQREKRMSEVLQAGLLRLRRAWPDVGITARGNGRLPWTLDAVVPASSVGRLAAEPGVSEVWVKRIRGIRRRQAKRQHGLFCVWGRVAIQVEGRTRGLVDVEDRLMLVRALTEEDAKKRLAKSWREYASPYLNSRGELVRWQLVEVVDVYHLYEDELDPSGTEVYSRIRPKRMKAAYMWKRRAKGA
jgi:hypothetical protein